MTDFAELTTLRVGGPAGELITLDDPATVVADVREAWARAADWLVLGGGSNLLVADEGFDGTVLRMRTRGIEVAPRAGGDGRVRLRAQAGEDWDALVRFAVERGLGGIEAMSGVPGSVGAAPVQNIGAYGQELSDTLVAVELVDGDTGERLRVEAAELALGYRTSAIKQGRSAVVTAIELALVADPLGAPVRYVQLAAALGVGLGDRVPVAAVREAVLRLRSAKGMLLDAGDPDSVSAGSFFTNPVVSASFAGGLPPDVPRFPLAADAADAVVPLGAPPAPPPAPAGDAVKLSAAWLIERAGIPRGFALPGSRAGVSTKHSLALVNRGGARAAELAELARYIQTRVLSEFGVALQPEPLLVGVVL
ncbi:MAG: UDP-N-acetylmuramate dehydrogenase [Microbacteriaceae bacterium]